MRPLPATLCVIVALTFSLACEPQVDAALLHLTGLDSERLEPGAIIRADGRGFPPGREAVAAGWDTDCNGATVGALWGLSGRALPPHWTRPWNGRVEVTLAGMGEVALDELVERTLRVADTLRAAGVEGSDIG